MSTNEKVEDSAPEPKSLSGLSGWLQKLLTPLVKSAVDEAVADLRADIDADMTNMETHLLAQMTQLPGLVASQVANVALNAEQVAQKVAENFGNFLNPANLAQDVANRTGGFLPDVVSKVLNPGALSQQIIQGVLGGIHIPFLGVHETVSPEQAHPKSKAEQIREKLDQRRSKADEDQ